MDSTLKEILDEPLAVELFNQYAPEMLNHPMIEFAYGLSVSEMLANVPDETETLFRMVIDALNKSTLENQL